eukprot:c10421_g1_i1.p1 GENE.c10421_g1_i1~~c10421_g1_i1.p1  ORF type:complete len:331 (-),score=120.48 c10421_g1_i1:57-980(-)
MQEDDDVGKIASATPSLVARAVEVFLDRFVQASADVAQANGSKTIQPSHLRVCVMEKKEFDFLKDLVAEISDLKQKAPTKPSPNLSGSKRSREESTIKRENKKKSVPKSKMDDDEDDDEDEYDDDSGSGEDREDRVNQKGKSKRSYPTQQSLAKSIQTILSHNVGKPTPILALKQDSIAKIDQEIALSKLDKELVKQKHKKRDNAHAKETSSIANSESEKYLKTVATKGVVFLFNAITAAQEKKKQKAKKKQKKKQEAAPKPTSNDMWKVLSDDFMMNPKMSDWKESTEKEEEQYSDAGIASESDDD